MKKIVIGGQLEQNQIKSIIDSVSNGRFETFIASDIDAAMKMKNNEADYYFGACNTGGGGALAMAIAMLGADKTVSLSTPSSKMNEDQIKDEIKKGKVAFGMLSDTIEEIIPLVIRNLK